MRRARHRAALLNPGPGAGRRARHRGPLPRLQGRADDLRPDPRVIFADLEGLASLA
jgi:hypothetical protein